MRLPSRWKSSAPSSVSMVLIALVSAGCNVSQPALTKAIKTIETELGAPLFHREGKRILLSDFGRSLLPHFQHIAHEAEATRLMADNFRLLNNVPVRVGVMSTIGPVRLSAVPRRIPGRVPRHRGCACGSQSRPSPTWARRSRMVPE